MELQTSKNIIVFESNSDDYDRHRNSSDNSTKELIPLDNLLRKDKYVEGCWLIASIGEPWRRLTTILFYGLSNCLLDVDLRCLDVTNIRGGIEFI